LNWWAPAPSPGKKPRAPPSIERASQSLRDLRVAEVVELDMQITDGKVEAYRAKVKVSFKFEEHQ
jgi:dodecin